MRAAALFLILGLLAAPAGPVLAVDPQEQLKDAGLEARAAEFKDLLSSPGAEARRVIQFPRALQATQWRGRTS